MGREAFTGEGGADPPRSSLGRWLFVGGIVSILVALGLVGAVGAVGEFSLGVLTAGELAISLGGIGLAAVLVGVLAGQRATGSPSSLAPGLSDSSERPAGTDHTGPGKGASAPTDVASTDGNAASAGTAPDPKSSLSIDRIDTRVEADDRLSAEGVSAGPVEPDPSLSTSADRSGRVDRTPTVPDDDRVSARGSPIGSDGPRRTDGGVDAIRFDASVDRYCGNCTYFQYARTETGLSPYCGYHEELMADMESCLAWQSNETN
jgi:hypothetical protein